MKPPKSERGKEKWKAVFEVEFDKSVMWDDDDMHRFRTPLGVIKYIFKEEGLGMFDEEFKLIDVIPKKKGPPK